MSSPMAVNRTPSGQEQRFLATNCPYLAKPGRREAEPALSLAKLKALLATSEVFLAVPLLLQAKPYLSLAE